MSFLFLLYFILSYRRAGHRDYYMGAGARSEGLASLVARTWTRRSLPVARCRARGTNPAASCVWMRRNHLPSSYKHSYILFATDYFTKWAEAIPYESITQKTVIKFIEEKIIHRFGLPESITADQGTVLTGSEVMEFV